MYNINHFSWNINHNLVNFPTLIQGRPFYYLTMETFGKVSPSFCFLKFNFSSMMNFLGNIVDIKVN